MKQILLSLKLLHPDIQPLNMLAKCLLQVQGRLLIKHLLTSLVAETVKHLPTMWETWV